MSGSRIDSDGWTDSHLHLGRHEFAGEAGAVVARAVAAGVGRFLNVGYDPESSRFAVDLAQSDPRIFASAGVHPHDAALVADPEGRITPPGQAVLDGIRALASNPRTLAIGEIGLDYYRDLSPRPAQETAFRAQLDLADALDRPVILHIRDAYDEAVAVLESRGLPRRGGVMHAFAGEARHAQWAAAHGLLLGIGGPLTYRNSRLPLALHGVEPEHLVLETDAPWLPPEPFRGKRNEPAYLVHTARKLAEVLGIPLSDLSRATERNFERVFVPGGRS